MLRLFEEYIHTGLQSFSTKSFSGIPEALNALEGEKSLPELIICDIEMPDINGLILKEMLF